MNHFAVYVQVVGIENLNTSNGLIAKESVVDLVVDAVLETGDRANAISIAKAHGYAAPMVGWISPKAYADYLKSDRFKIRHSDDRTVPPGKKGARTKPRASRHPHFAVYTTLRNQRGVR